MMKMKNTMIASAVAVIAVAGGAYATQKMALNTYNQVLLNTPAITSIESGYTFKSGNLFIESVITDFNGFEWQAISNVAMVEEGLGIQLTSKAFAINDDTATQYPNWINAKNNSLNAIADTTINLDGFKSDVRFKPAMLNTPSGKIGIPETAIFIEGGKQQYPTIVVAALGDISVDAAGNTASFKQPRLKYVPMNKNNTVKYSVKFDAVNVGLVEVSKSTTVDFVVHPKQDDTFDLAINASIEQISGLKNFKSDLMFTNLTDQRLSSLASAASNAFATDLATKVSNLTAIFDYAKVGGEASVKIQAKDLESTPLNVNAELKFDEYSRESITKQNVFSILDSAILNADITLPVGLATTIAGPEWINAFIRDGMVKLNGNVVKSEINIKNMDANINGVQYSL
ncbi:hypothetical protein [Vibrio sp. 10N.239.312.D08]|uniref:hypothetical protein n=1 Tax=Vibrio sp. 10N.239.312.D08 TaxID=3229978 RepID=UPI00354B35C9